MHAARHRGLSGTTDRRMHHLGVLLLVGLAFSNAFTTATDTSECLSATVADVCAAYAQDCVDPQPWADKNNWQCHCATGDPGIVGDQMPALCPDDGPDCVQNDCKTSQLCLSGEPDNDGVYECHCKGPGKGVAQPECVGEAYMPDVAMNPFGYLDCARFVFEATAGDACACDTEIEGATVQIEDPTYDTKDTLACPSCASGNCDFGNCNFVIVKTTPSLILEMKGTASIAEYAKAIKSLEFKTASAEGAQRRITYTLGAVRSVDDHFYQFYDETAYEPYRVNGVTHWEAAQAFCADKVRDVFGMPGYMVTLTSQQEQDHVFANVEVGAETWLGISDIGKEGTYKWITGPEGCDRTDAQLATLVGAKRTGCDIFPIKGGKGASDCGDRSNPECQGGTLLSLGNEYSPL